MDMKIFDYSDFSLINIDNILTMTIYKRYDTYFLRINNTFDIFQSENKKEVEKMYNKIKKLMESK